MDAEEQEKDDDQGRLREVFEQQAEQDAGGEARAIGGKDEAGEEEREAAGGFAEEVCGGDDGKGQGDAGQGDEKREQRGEDNRTAERCGDAGKEVGEDCAVGRGRGWMRGGSRAENVERWWWRSGIRAGRG